MEPEDEKAVMLFGRDISKIPCFRNTFLYSISGGIGTGLMYFMFTSKPRIATHVGMASFTFITFAYWFQCRYEYSKTKFEMLRIQKLLRDQALYEGTETEREVDRLLITEATDV